MSERTERRICIMGTAPTWRNIPWDDPTLEIWALNDSWLLNPPKVDRWFDLHPFEKFFFRRPDQKLHAHDKPAGMFLRPEGHIEWLKKQHIPVYVQNASDLGTPSARTFPKAEIEAKFGPHFASSPAWMIGFALLEGVTELHIYGIHLATEWEYLKQKPNMTFLLGLAAGLGVRVVLPKGCPLIAEKHQYAYEVDPDIQKEQAQNRVKHLDLERKAILKRTPAPRWWRRPDPNLASRLAWVNAQILDAQLGVQCVVAGQPPVGV